MDKHRTVFLERTRNALRAHLWAAVGKATAYVALGNWPEGVRSALYALHKHAYFTWADSSRANAVPKCVGCSGPLLDDDVDGLRIVQYRGLTFCSASCLEKFTRDVLRSQPVMPS